MQLQSRSSSSSSCLNIRTRRPGPPRPLVVAGCYGDDDDSHEDNAMPVVTEAMFVFCLSFLRPGSCVALRCIFASFLACILTEEALATPPECSFQSTFRAMAAFWAMVGEAAMMQRCQDDSLDILSHLPVKSCDTSLGMQKRPDSLDTSASDIEGP